MLIEVVVAMGILVLFALAFITFILGAYDGGRRSRERTEASYFALEGLESVRSIARQDFDLLRDGDFGITKGTGGILALSTTPPDVWGKYERTITIQSVHRTEEGMIVDFGGEEDESSKWVTSTVTWSNRTLKQQTILTDWTRPRWLFDLLTQAGSGSIHATSPAGTGGGIEFRSDGDLSVPEIFMEIALSGSVVRDVHLDGDADRAYVITQDNPEGAEFLAFDLSDISNEKLPVVQSKDLETGGISFVIGKEYAYVTTAHYDRDLEVIRLSDFETVASWNIDESALPIDLAVDEERGKAYVLTSLAEQGVSLSQLPPVLVTTGVWPFDVDPAYAQVAPTCNGQTATIYVDGSNNIVSTIAKDNGDPYTGTLNGDNGVNVIVGTSGADTINGKNGNDVICGGGGNDTIDAGRDNDTVFGEAGADNIDGGAGADTICAGADNDTVTGGSGDDSIDGSTGTDTLDGERDSDICRNGESNSNCEDTTSGISTCGVAASDTTAPSVSTLTPADNATDISVSTNLVIVFDESVNVETGNVTIKKTSDNSTVETIDITSGQVTGDGTDTITINPASDLDTLIEYYVQVDATAIDDLYGNSFAGILDTTTWSFTTEASCVPDPLPTCNSQTATVYVDNCDFIVGGDDSGSAYTGTINGSNSADVIVGTSSADTINGKNGNDVICGGDGADTIDGGNKDDTIFGEAGADTIDTGNGTNTACGGADNDNITGGNGDDSLAGSDGTDTIDGGGGTDICRDGETVSNCEDELSAIATCGVDAGCDPGSAPTCNSQTATIYVDNCNTIVGGPDDGTAYTGTINGNANVNDVIVGTDSADTLDGKTGDDTICAGAGNDTIIAGAGLDIVFGEEGNDTISAAGGDDIICAGAGDDTVTAEGGNDQIDGGAGTDDIDGGGQTDICRNGETYTLCEDTASAIDTCGVAAGDGTAPTVDSFSPADESTTASSTDNLIITFSEAVNVVSGTIRIYDASNNTLIESIDVTSGQVTGDGTTTITINPTNDFSAGSSYYIQIDDTAFDDLAGNSYAGISDKTTWNFTISELCTPSTIPQCNSLEATIYVDNCDNVYGGPGSGSTFAGTLTGTAGVDDVIVGTTGNDTISGDTGDDTICGSDGNDTITGGDGADLLVGEAGNDTLNAGAGNDIICAGGDNDALNGGTGDDQLSGGAGIDTIDGGADSDICREGETLSNCEDDTTAITVCGTAASTGATITGEDDETAQKTKKALLTLSQSLYVFDISDPENTETNTATAIDVGLARGLAYYGGYVYIISTQNTAELKVLNTSTNEITSCDLPGDQVPNDIVIEDGRMFIGRNKGVAAEFIEIRIDPANPADCESLLNNIVLAIDLDADAREISLQLERDLAFVLTGFGLSDLTVINLQTEYAMEHEPFDESDGLCDGLHTIGSYLFVACRGEGAVTVLHGKEDRDLDFTWGTYTSPAFDTSGYQVRPDRIKWSRTGEGNIFLRIRTADTPENLAIARWVGKTGSVDSVYDDPNGHNIVTDPEATGTRYLQWKAYFRRYGTSSPILKNVVLTFE